MQVKIKCFGIYGVLLGNEIWLDIDANETLSDVLKKLENEIKSCSNKGLLFLGEKEGKPLSVLINNELADLNRMIRHGDEIKIMPIIGGG
jgi:molybdopterin converting factor small subunit